MTPQEIKAAGQLMIDYATAKEKGEEFEVQHQPPDGYWRDIPKHLEPNWNWFHGSFRRKPKIIKAELWALCYKDGVIHITFTNREDAVRYEINYRGVRQLTLVHLTGEKSL